MTMNRLTHPERTVHDVERGSSKSSTEAEAEKAPRQDQEGADELRRQALTATKRQTSKAPVESFLDIDGRSFFLSTRPRGPLCRTSHVRRIVGDVLIDFRQHRRVRVT